MAEETGPRRRHPRVAAHLPVRLATIDPETDPDSGRTFFRSASAWSGNVSRGGMFVHTREPLIPGRRVLVELSLPGGDVEAVGRVAWSRRVLHPDGRSDERAGVGVQFVGASREEIRRLERYVRDQRGRRHARGSRPRVDRPGHAERAGR